MRYDDAFWLPSDPRRRFGQPRSAYSELHDYDFEMRGPYAPGRLLDAYMDWRQYRRESAAAGSPEPVDDLGRLREWEEWRRMRHLPEAVRRRWLRERRRGRVRGPRWPRADL